MEPIKIPLMEATAEVKPPTTPVPQGPLQSVVGESNPQPQAASAVEVKSEESSTIKCPLDHILIKSPETNKQIDFKPQETVRSPKWFYPFPSNFDSEKLTIADIAELLGIDTAKDFLIESLTRRCQALWKESLAKAPAEGVTPEDYFATWLFDINRKTGEDTPEKLAKLIAEKLKEIKSTKSSGASVETLAQLKAEYLDLKQRQDKILLAGI